MRVIAGSARGRTLKPPATSARATSDLVRGAIFDALEAQGADFSRVLDLYAGSGALGIEALSRGAEQCDFVESESNNAAVIRQNLESTGLAKLARVYRMRVERAAEHLDGAYTLVLADPPYDDEDAIGALDSIGASGLVEPGRTTFVVEYSSRREPPERLGPIATRWSRRHGDTRVVIYGSEPA